MMMNCEQALEAISARLDGALSEEENRELETHLASCASCRALLKELTELEEGLGRFWSRPRRRWLRA